MRREEYELSEFNNPCMNGVSLARRWRQIGFRFVWGWCRIGALASDWCQISVSVSEWSGAILVMISDCCQIGLGFVSMSDFPQICFDVRLASDWL